MPNKILYHLFLKLKTNRVPKTKQNNTTDKPITKAAVFIQNKSDELSINKEFKSEIDNCNRSSQITDSC